MKKTLLAFVLLSLGIARGGITININTPQEFVQFSKDVNAQKNRDATVFLQNDIDLTELSDQFQSIGNIYGTSFLRDL